MNPLVAKIIPVFLEDLCRPANDDTQLLHISTQAKACAFGSCCMRGKSIPCKAIYPDENGIVVEREEGAFFLNNKEQVTPVQIALERITFERSNGSTIIAGWTIPCKITDAYKHPWGVLMIRERSLDPQFQGIIISLLITPH